jgi:hypothetical protein
LLDRSLEDFLIGARLESAKATAAKARNAANTIDDFTNHHNIEHSPTLLSAFLNLKPKDDSWGDNHPNYPT